MIWVITSEDMKYSADALYYFKKEFECRKGSSGILNITADARYKLWVNGNMASIGPYKGNDNEQYYATVDISRFLKPGKNEIFVEVLQLTAAKDLSGHRYLSSVPRTGNMALLVWGSISDNEETWEFGTDGSWLCAKEENIEFIIPDYAYYGGLGESIGNGYKKTLEWKNAKEWIAGEEIIFYGETKLWNIKKSNFPMQKYEPHILNNKDEAGNFDFGRVVTGFVRITASGSGKIKITYAESYVFNENGEEVKRNRTDSSGEIKGDYDLISVDGDITYEPFWFRTFRYIKIEADKNVKIDNIRVMETGYPITVADDYDFGCDTDNKLWEISVNTLKCCMHETYEDCPYYEQLQYAMDTYLQIIFSLKLSNDATLAKRAVHAFAASLQSGGICQSRFPSITPQYIVGFSLYIVFILDAIERICGEKEFIKKHLGIIDTVFCAFEDMKRDDGLLEKSRYWNFIDWANGWEEGHGVPVSEAGDTLTVYNMMYAHALETAARLCSICGRRDTAAEYTENAKKIKEVIKEKCYCTKKQLFADTDKKQTFSQHAQIWAVLSSVAEGDEAARLMRETVEMETSGGFAYAFYVFRAFEKAGIYELTEPVLDKYRGLIDLGCTTIPEVPGNSRSECHAWGAVAIYEFTAMILGVKESEGYILINPYIKGRNYAKGSVNTRYGKVYVCWEKTDDKFSISVNTESNAEIRIVMPDGSIVSGKGKAEGKAYA